MDYDVRMIATWYHMVYNKAIIAQITIKVSNKLDFMQNRISRVLIFARNPREICT